MVVYFILPLLIGGIFAINKYVFKSNQKISLLISIIMLTIIMAFRSEFVGTDTKTYINIFYDIANSSFDYALSQDKYIGFAILCFIISKISDSSMFYLTVISIITSFLTYKVITKYSNNYFLSIVFYVITYHFCSSMNVSRNYIAILAVLLSLNYLYEKKYLIGFVLLLFAISFHLTSIIGLLFLPLLYSFKRNKGKYKILLLLCYILLFFFFDYFGVLFSKIFPEYYLYFENASTSVNSVNGGKTIILRFFNLIVGIIILILSRKYKSKINTKQEMLIYIFILSSLLGTLFSNRILVNRILTYFSIVDFLTIPILVSFFNNKNDRILITIVLILVYFIPYSMFILGNYGGIVPYQLSF